jgi:hypothetical protein
MSDKPLPAWTPEREAEIDPVFAALRVRPPWPPVKKDPIPDQPLAAERSRKPRGE